MQAEAAQRERNRRLLIAVTAIAVVVIIVVALVIAKLVSGGSSKDASTPAQTGLSTVVSGVTTVPPATLDAVGAGTAVGLKAVSGIPALTADGHPEVLYVGGEFCPYCAATRWGVVVALSRFGTFHGLGLMSSSSSDVYPDTATLTFHGATYTSSHVTFHGYEVLDRNKQPLDTLSGTDQTTVQTYNAPPYAPSAGSIPFVDIGGRYFLYGSAYNPQVLQGLTQLQIVRHLADPSSQVAQAILGEANMVTAAICQSTSQQPSSVCSSAGVQAAAAKLTSG